MADRFDGGVADLVQIAQRGRALRLGLAWSAVGFDAGAVSVAPGAREFYLCPPSVEDPIVDGFQCCRHTGVDARVAELSRDPTLGTLGNLIEPAIDRAKSDRELTP